MARLPRLSVACLPHHVIWCSLAHQPLFLDDADRRQFLLFLSEQSHVHAVSLQAYVLLDHEVQLLGTPETSQGLSLMMQGIGRHYVRYFNRRYRRQGTLWEGRYRCTVVEAGEAELDVMCFMDNEAVRTGCTSSAALFPWSSHAHYRGLIVDKGLTAPAVYWDLGNTPFAREAAYAERVAQDLPADKRARIRDAAMKGWVMGSAGFIESVQALVGRRVIRSRPGRPRKPL